MSKGLRLDQFKEPAFSSDILKIDSQRVYIDSVYNSPEDSNFKFLFAPGSKIQKNNIIASKKYKNKIINIFAPKDFEVKETKYLINEKDQATSYVILESNKLNKSNIISFESEDINYFQKDLINKTDQEILDISYKASIIDETDGVYLFEKFEKLINNKFNNKIYIDAIDDQPYTSSKESILLHYPNAINFVSLILKKAFNIDIDIIFYDIESYNKEKKFSEEVINTNILHIRGNYPVRHHISKKFNYNFSIGIQAILHLARALINPDYKQTTTFITVSGPAVFDPKNIEVFIGTSTQEIIENFKLKSNLKRVILGQAITGVAISELQTPVSASTRSILIFDNYNILKQMECIGCSRCSDVCPQNLLPSYRHKFKETGDQSFEEFSSEAKCIKCYCCSYICPSHINLV
ncbi:MAG: 4Fe-4S dicluster domain-containing protein [Oscillospiraceae bacterium]|nr:4Fe-4S dicluster domain-containing protein [Oscillospiraceae bacterium]